METECINGVQEEQGKFQQILLALFICGVACLCYYLFIVNTARVDVELGVSQESNFALYWAAEGQSYSEGRTVSIRVHPGKTHYSFYLTNISKVNRLRVDTHSYVGTATLQRLVIQQEGYETTILATAESFKRLLPLQQIESSDTGDDGLKLTSAGSDPNFEFKLTPHYLGIDKAWLFVRMLVISILFFAIVYCCSPLVSGLNIVPVLLFGAWLFIITMAGVSKENVHPDEYVHIAAAHYYADHWLPPEIEDPDIRHTYSVYGVSRLNRGEIYYVFAGKMYQFLHIFQMPSTFAYRFFNVALFGVIFLLSIRSFYARIAALPFLVSSQVWYVFSYCNSDAFALFAAFLASWQLIDPQSLLHRYLKGGGLGLRLVALVVLPFILGMLFLLKMNYYPLLGLFYLVLLVKILFTEDYYWEKKDAITRLILISILGLSFLGVRVVADHAINGMDRSAKIEQLREKLADVKYKRTSPLEEMGPTMYLKDKGATFKDLISRYHWDIKSFASSFGVFGYTDIVSPHHFYTMVRWAGSALVAYILLLSFLRGGWVGAGITIVVCGLSVILILAGMYHCWVFDFQAQGRYFFPILPMFAVVLGSNLKAFDGRILTFLVSVMCVLGLYSFIFQGLLRIPKITF
jgi:hypothetical protein